VDFKVVGGNMSDKGPADGGFAATDISRQHGNPFSVFDCKKQPEKRLFMSG